MEYIELENPELQAQSTSNSQELAEKLSNPVAALINVPFQSTFDFNMGTGSGFRYTAGSSLKHRRIAKVETGYIE